MSPLFFRRLASWPRFALIAAVCAAPLLAPAAGWAADPVKKLRDALKITELDMVPKRDKMIKEAIKEFKSISDWRQAVFLREWNLLSLAIVLDPMGPLLKKRLAAKKQLEAFRTEIGDQFIQMIGVAADEPNVEKKLAIAILIAA